MTNLLQGEQFNSLRKAFIVYLNRVWKPLKRLASKEFIDLSEVSVMLSEQIDQWVKDKIQEGLQQGIQQGMQYSTLKLLEHKFPASASSFKERIEEMPYDALEILLDRIIKAKSVDELADIMIVHEY